MANREKKAERDRKAKAYRDFARGLAAGSGQIYRPTATSIFDCVNKARLNEQQAASSRLARKTLFGEDPRADVPEELSDAAISQYLADAATLYAGVATDYMLISDPVRAYQYFSRAARLCATAAEAATNNGSKLLDEALQYKDKASIVRHDLAKRSVRRKRLSLGFLPRLR